VGEIALLGATFGFRHGDAVFFQQRLHVAYLLGELLDLRVAGSEFLFDFLLSPLCRSSLAEQPLAVNEPDLVVGALRKSGNRERRDEQRGTDANKKRMSEVFHYFSCREAAMSEWLAADGVEA